jgi:hypothetical protein
VLDHLVLEKVMTTTSRTATNDQVFLALIAMDRVLGG